MQIANNTISTVAPVTRVDEILRNVKLRSSIIEQEELKRVNNPIYNASDVVMHGGRGGNFKVFSMSETIWGNNIETYDEEVQCNMYEDIRAQLEAQLEDEVFNPVVKEKERGKKVI